jgi:hypothetical protein
MLSALICGGNWNNGVICGGRAVNLNNYPWNVNTNIGSRLACDSVYAGLWHHFRYGALRSSIQ